MCKEKFKDEGTLWYYRAKHGEYTDYEAVCEICYKMLEHVGHKHDLMCMVPHYKFRRP